MYKCQDMHLTFIQAIYQPVVSDKQFAHVAAGKFRYSSTSFGKVGKRSGGIADFPNERRGIMG